MSCKVMYTCDHCGKEVSPYIGKQWKAGFLTVGPNIEDIHACSFEHLTLALAKTFYIPLDASTLRLVTEKNDALNAARAAIVECDNMRARLAELEARMPANEVTNAERAQYEATIELQRKRIEELQANVDGLERDRRHCVEAISESNLVPPGRTLVEGIGELVRLQRHAVKKIVDNTSPSLDDLAKKLVPVFEQAFKDGPNNRLQSVRAGLRAALAALPMPFAQPMTVDGKTPGQTDDALFDLYMDHVGFFDMNGTMLQRENMIETLAALEQEQAITLPTKPTKPLSLVDYENLFWKLLASLTLADDIRDVANDVGEAFEQTGAKIHDDAPDVWENIRRHCIDNGITTLQDTELSSIEYEESEDDE